jgi:O-antigen biosynthesis protein
VQPKVSCVLPFAGRAEMVARAVRCFEGQIYPNKSLHQLANNGERSVGALRNAVNALADGEIICHFDSDDWSHPSRIAEQVALLQSSGADAVGYREMLFWRTPENEAWLYVNRSPKPYALGTSLCYWRKTWEAKRFPAVVQPHNPNVNYGEDTAWIKGLKLNTEALWWKRKNQRPADPRMIASIHGGNTSPAYKKLKGPEWTRVPEWDEYCAREMKL